ncbi:MAG TPA: response regulator [Patescibacteria group bacterium]|nr:response regulator [Patescibacteria group bacterium]
MRILVADDDLTLARLIEHRLRERGYEVLVTQDAIQTWQCIQRESPDLVVLDIKMPGGSGLAVLRRLKQNLNNRGVPIIVITAAEDPAILQQAADLHPEALLRKPVLAAKLEFEIARLLAGRGFVKADEAPQSKARR